MDFSPEQLVLISLVAMGLAWGLWFVLNIIALITKKPLVKPQEKWLKLVVFVASTGVAYAWAPRLPLPDPGLDLWGFVTGLLLYAVTSFKIAQQVYDLIWQPFTELIDKLLGRVFGRTVVFFRP